MIFDVIEGLNEEQINKLYDDIAENNEDTFISYDVPVTVTCDDGTVRFFMERLYNEPRGFCISYKAGYGECPLYYDCICLSCGRGHYGTCCIR